MSSQFAKAVEEVRALGGRTYQGAFSYVRDADAAMTLLRERGFRVSKQSVRILGSVAYKLRIEVDGRWQDLF